MRVLSDTIVDNTQLDETNKRLAALEGRDNAVAVKLNMLRAALCLNTAALTCLGWLIWELYQKAGA